MSDEPMGGFDDLEHELAELGPLMAQQEVALNTEPEPEFVRTLRNRLTGEGEAVAAPTRSSPRERLAAWARKYGVVAGGLAAAAAVALIVLVGGNRPGVSPVPTPIQSAFHLPAPTGRDITRSYPVAGGLGGGPVPPVWASNLQPPPGTAYGGRLTLNSATLPSQPDRAPAYRLAGPRFDAPRLRAMAASLGIAGSVRHMTVEGDRWAYLSQQTGPMALHSLAVNLRTGELVYHDTRVSAPVPTRVTRTEQEAARRWMSRLGWPGGTMRLRQPWSPQEAALSWAVRFDWPNVGANVPAASVSVDTRGVVTDAVLEPPAVAMEQVPLKSRQAAWNELQKRGGPIAVEGMVGVPPKPGTATLTYTWMAYIVAHAPDGTGYLVPAYHFEGRATISGDGTKRWFAIVPAAK